jgi:hypothetical protein
MKRMICLWIGLALFSLFVALPAHAQSVNRFSLTAAGQNLAPGQSLLVSLQADISTPSQGFSIQLGYDPACLELISNTPTGLLSTDAFPVDKSAVGLIDVAYTLLGGEKTLSGSGVLLEIEFKTLKVCQTNLQLSSAQLVAFDDQGKARYIDVQPGASLAIAISPQAEIPILPPPAADQTSSLDPMPTILPDSLSPAVQQSAQINLLPILRAAATPLLLGGLFIVASITLLIVGSRLKKSRPKTLRAAYAGGSPTMYEEQPLLSGSYLLIEWGAQLTKCTLHTSPFNIGRELGSQLTLSNPLVSRMHAQLIQIGADWYISDNHSRNGTYVNGHLVQYPQRLSPGDQIRLGRQVGLRFR